ncbi:MAG TPA: cytidylate kinase-like family protein [Dehalococcoidia bacterium]|nr:cytidylate kinase-like family protein [Dehalococcoidia bacterium]
MPVITVSGSLGSGARDLAHEVAEAMRLDYVDQEILVEAARQLGVSVAAIERHDERPSSLAERLGGLMRTLMERSAAAGGGDPLGGGEGLQNVLARTYGEAAELPSEGDSGDLDDDRYLRTLTSVIKGVAARGNVVILGRGSQAILQHEPESLHVYVYAPKQARIDALVARDGMTPDEAERRIKESDQNRSAFHQRYFKVDADRPALYDLTINSSRIQLDLAVKLVELAVRDRTPRPG